MRAWMIEMERTGSVEYYDPDMQAWRERSRLERERFSIVAETPFQAEAIAGARLDGRIVKVCRGGDVDCENPLSEQEKRVLNDRGGRDAVGEFASAAF